MIGSIGGHCLKKALRGEIASMTAKPRTRLYGTAELGENYSVG